MGEDTTKIKSDALRLLSFRPRSEKELRQRLKLKKHPAPLIEEVLDLLKRQGMLDDASKKAVADAVIERLDSETRFRGKQYRLRSVIQIQARALATFLRREGSYEPYAWKW